jgi:ABC-2 type transport system permease protein
LFLYFLGHQYPGRYAQVSGPLSDKTGKLAFWLPLKVWISAVFITIPGIVMVVYAAIHLGIQLTVGGLLGYLLLLLLMILLFYDIMLIIRTAAFRFIIIDALGELENELIGFSMKVPGVVFKGVSKLILYVLLPYALFATIPTQFFTEGLTGGMWLLVLGVVSAFTLLAQMLWRWGLKSYSSASS